MGHTQIVKDKKKARHLKGKKEREDKFWQDYRAWVTETCGGLGIEDSCEALENCMDTDPISVFILECVE